MNRRTILLRLGTLAAVGGAVAGAVTMDRSRPDVFQPGFGIPLDHPMTYSVDGAASSVWFCPGVPATDAVSGSFAILNPTDSPIKAIVSVSPLGLPLARRVVDVPVRGRVEIVAFESGAATFAAALVEIDGVGGLVEQLASAPQGISATPCATATSQNWFSAEGSTVLGDSLLITLFNPYASDAIVDLTFADEEGPRRPKKFEGRVVPARSMISLDISSVILRKKVVSVAADVRDGLVVMGRHQIYGGQDSQRFGLVNGVAMPSASTSWRFANNQKGSVGEGDPPAAERFVVFNPSDTDVEVNATVLPATAIEIPEVPAPLPADPAADPNTTTVPVAGPVVPAPLTVVIGPNQVGEISISGSASIGDGVYSVVISASGPIAVDRVLDRTIAGKIATSVQPGARLTSPRWFAAAAPAPNNTILYVLNATGGVEPSTITIKSIGPAGAIPIPGLENVPIGAGALLEFNLLDKNVGGQMLLIEGATPIIVERVVATGAPSISSSLGVPVVTL